MRYSSGFIALLLGASAALAQPPTAEPEGADAPAASDQPAPEPRADRAADLETELARLRAERKALRETREAIASDRGADADRRRADELARLRSQIQDVATKLATRRALEAEKPAPGSRPALLTSSPGTAAPELAPGKQAPFVPPASPLDPIAMGQALLRAGDHAAALEALSRVDIAPLRPEDQLAVQYLTATSLRKLGKTSEAATLYREVANGKGDLQLIECARWQLSALQWRQAVELRLEQVRQRRQALGRNP